MEGHPRLPSAASDSLVFPIRVTFTSACSTLSSFLRCTQSVEVPTLTELPIEIGHMSHPQWYMGGGGGIRISSHAQSANRAMRNNTWLLLKPLCLGLAVMQPGLMHTPGWRSCWPKAGGKNVEGAVI